jgi:hypothetical protein
MKHKLVVALSILAIIVSTVVAVRAYDHYQVHAHAVAAAKAANQAAHDKLESAAVAANKKHIDEECTKEVTYYNGLTPAQKTKVSAPACDLQIVQ